MKDENYGKKRRKNLVTKIKKFKGIVANLTIRLKTIKYVIIFNFFLQI